MDTKKKTHPKEAHDLIIFENTKPEDHNYNHCSNYDGIGEWVSGLSSGVTAKENLRKDQRAPKQQDNVPETMLHTRNVKEKKHREEDHGVWNYQGIDNNWSAGNHGVSAKRNSSDGLQAHKQYYYYGPAVPAMSHVAGNLGLLERNVLLLGTSGAGKYTVAKNMASDKNDFPPKYIYSGVGSVHSIAFNQHKFVFIDTAGIQLDHELQQVDKLSADAIRKQIMAIFPGIHLILLVVRKGCCTPEELESLADIVETLFTAKTRKYIALIHSGCENLDDESKLKYLNSFAASSGPSGRLSSLCDNATLTVGFPNLTETSEAFVHVHKESIHQSIKSLRDLSISSGMLEPISGVFTRKKFPDRVQSLLFPDAKCIVM